MSEKPNSARGEPLESQSSATDSGPADAYKVGPGRPPRDKRWKKGGPSPNPRGRPRKDQSMRPDRQEGIRAGPHQEGPGLPRGDKKVLMTRVEIGLEQLLNQFAKGDRHARPRSYGVRRQAGHRFFEPIPPRNRGGAHPQPPDHPRCVSRPPQRCRKPSRRPRLCWHRRSSSMMMPRSPKPTPPSPTEG